MISSLMFFYNRIMNIRIDIKFIRIFSKNPTDMVLSIDYCCVKALYRNKSKLEISLEIIESSAISYQYICKTQ